MAGLGLLTWALIADQRWFDSHFLPAFFVSRDAYVRGEWLGRIAAALLGLVLALVVRPRVGRFVARRPALVLATAAGLGRPRPQRREESRGLNVYEADPSTLTVRTFAWDGVAFGEIGRRTFERAG